MINYDVKLDTRVVEQDLCSPSSAVSAYKWIIEYPGLLREFSQEEIIRIYAILHHSERTNPRPYGSDSFDRKPKPHNGLLKFLIENHPGLSPGFEDEAKRTADCFTDYDMKTIQRGEAKPFDYKIRLSRNGNGEEPLGSGSGADRHEYFNASWGIN